MNDISSTISSTDNSREYWREQSKIDGTDWASLLARAADVVGGLYAVHVPRMSS